MTQSLEWADRALHAHRQERESGELPADREERAQEYHDSALFAKNVRHPANRTSALPPCGRRCCNSNAPDQLPFRTIIVPAHLDKG